MKRLVLAIGLMLAAGLLFAAGPQGGAGAARQTQAQTGDCDGIPDQIRDQLQLQDGSCLDDFLTVESSPILGSSATQSRDQLQDCTSDGVPDQDRIQQSRP